MAKEWYIRQGSKLFGPFAPDKLKSLVAAGKVTTQAEVANEKAGPWHPITKLNGLSFPGDMVAKPPSPASQPVCKSTASTPQHTSPLPASVPPAPVVQSIVPAVPMQAAVGFTPSVPQHSTSNDARALLHYQANAKSAGIAIALWFLFGMFGAHRFYSGKTGSAVAQLLITIISIPLCIVLIGFLTIFANAIWVFIDVFLITGWIRDHNSRLANLVAQ